MNWHCGMDLENIVAKGCLAPLDDIWADKKDDYNPWVFEGVTVDGSIYAVPGQDDDEVIVYNKNLFKELGLKSWPSNWSQFEKIVDALIATGMDYPIAQNNADSWPTFYWFTYIYLYMFGPTVYNELMRGERKYTDSEAMATWEYWAQLMEAGWFGPDPSKNNAMTSTTTPPLFRENEIGMMLLPLNVTAGWWPELAAEDAIDLFALPPLQGSKEPLQTMWYIWPFCANSGTPEVEDTKLALEYFITKEGADAYNSTSGLNNPHKEMDTSVFIQQYLDFWETYPKKGGIRSYDDLGKPAFRFWEATAPEIHLKIPQAMAQMFVSKTPDYKAVAKECERIANKHWSSV